MKLLASITPILLLTGFLGVVHAQDDTAPDDATQNVEQELAEIDALLAELIEDSLRIYRTLGDTLGLDLLLLEESAILRWRPRAFDPEAPAPQIDLRAAMGAFAVPPLSETRILDTTDPAAITVLVDVGPTISGEEVGAFLFHARSLLLELPATVDITVQPLSGVPEVLPFTRDIVEMQEQLQALRKSEVPSSTIEFTLAAGALTSEAGTTRQAVYVMTDAAACAEGGAWEPGDLFDLYLETGVIYNVVLFADSEPSPACLQSLAALAETSGGTIYPIDQQGGNPVEPTSSIVGIIGGGEILFDLSSYTRLPYEAEETLFRIGMQFNGRSAEFALPYTLPPVGWGTTLQVLTVVYGPTIALGLMALAVVAGVCAFVLGLRQQPVQAWISPLSGVDDPQPVVRGGLALQDPDNADIRVKRKGRNSVRVWGGVFSVNGENTKDILIQDGDVFELAGGERFRLHLPTGTPR